jgi:FtsH-binding integral membrane protein
LNNPQVPTVFNVQTTEMQEEVQRGFILRVYAWMVLGLAITAAAALFTLTVPGLLETIITNPVIFFGLLIGELVLVVVLTAAINRFPPLVASLIFAGYAVLNGVTLSLLMLLYTGTSVVLTFGVTACTFGIMTLFGYTTHRDLTKLGSLLIMALIGLVVASIANLFFANTAIYWVITYVGILIFIGLIAYDTQRLKQMSLSLGSDGGVIQKASIMGALRLYLDFINLFLMLLRILGRRRS